MKRDTGYLVKMKKTRYFDERICLRTTDPPQKEDEKRLISLKNTFWTLELATWRLAVRLRSEKIRLVCNIDVVHFTSGAEQRNVSTKPNICSPPRFDKRSWQTLSRWPFSSIMCVVCPIIWLWLLLQSGGVYIFTEAENEETPLEIRTSHWKGIPYFRWVFFLANKSLLSSHNNC